MPDPFKSHWPPPRPSRSSGRTPTPTVTRLAANRGAATDGTSLQSLHPNAAETAATTCAEEKTRRPTQAQPRPRRRELLETTAVLRIYTSQMKASARSLEGRGHAEPQPPVVLRLLDYQHHKLNPCGKPSRYPTQKDAATNTASITQKPVGAWSRLTPTPTKTASWKGAEGAKTRPRASQTRPPQDR